MTSLTEINEIRQKGLRPQVVGCFLSQQKILFVYKRKHDLWQLPQGGIDNKETIDGALQREMEEELGRDFAGKIGSWEVFGEDEIVFPMSQANSRELFTDEGKEIELRGKHYFFCAIKTEQIDLDLSQTEFEDYKWADLPSAFSLTQEIYQKNKQKMTQKILELLKERGLL